MSVPSAVQKQADRADALAKQFAASQGMPVEEPSVGEPLIGHPPAGEPPVEELPIVEPPVEEPVISTAPLVEEPPVEEPGAKKREDWKQKYSILQGKYDAEVPRLHASVSDLTAQLTGLHNVVAAMQAPAAPAAPAAFDAKSIVSDSELEEYGEDLIDLVNRVAQSATAPMQAELQDIKARNVTLEQNLNGMSSRVVRSAQQDIYTKLDAAVEDWTILNVDEGFLNWLQGTDPLFGVTRGEALREAFSREDADRVIRFFNLYKQEHATPTTPAPVAPAPANAGKRDLGTLVAPGRGRPGAGGGTPSEEKRVIPRAEVQKFYLDSQKGEYAGREDERLKMEKEIFAAAAEGRVR